MEGYRRAQMHPHTCERVYTHSILNYQKDMLLEYEVHKEYTNIGSEKSTEGWDEKTSCVRSHFNDNHLIRMLKIQKTIWHLLQTNIVLIQIMSFRYLTGYLFKKRLALCDVLQYRKTKLINTKLLYSGWYILAWFLSAKIEPGNRSGSNC